MAWIISDLSPNHMLNQTTEITFSKYKCQSTHLDWHRAQTKGFEKLNKCKIDDEQESTLSGLRR